MTSQNIDLSHSNDLAIFVEGLNDFDLNALINTTNPEGRFRMLRGYAVYLKTVRAHPSNQKQGVK